jgi:uncharacterized protein (TIGR03437 family)
MRLLLPALLCLLLDAAPPVPVLSRNGVRNAASRIPATHPDAGIAPGSRITIEGLHLSSATAVRLGATPARIVTTSPTRIEAVIPANMPAGPSTLQVVSTSGGLSAPFPLTIAKEAPGLYSRNGMGWGPAQTQPTPAFRKGTTISLQGTGFATSASTARLFVGNIPVTAKLTRRRNSEGIVDLQVPIPAGAPSGCHVPIQAASQAVPTNTVTVPIHPCDPADTGQPAAQAPRTYGFVVRTDDANLRTTDMFAAFFRLTHLDQAGPLLQMPPPGACLASTFTVDEQQGFLANLPSLLFRGQPQILSAAPHLNLHAGNRNLRISPNDNGIVQRRLPPDRPQGSLTLTSPGSPAVGPFSIPASEPVRLQSAQLPKRIVRHQPLPLEWTHAAGSPDHPVLILLLAGNPDALTQGVVLCRSQASKERFTVEPRWLTALPPTIPGAPPATLLLATLPGKFTPITASGVDQAAYVPASVHSVAVSIE